MATWPAGGSWERRCRRSVTAASERYSNNRTIAQFDGSGALLRLSQSEFGSGTDEHVVHEQMLTRRSACCRMGTSAENAR